MTMTRTQTRTGAQAALGLATLAVLGLAAALPQGARAQNVVVPNSLAATQGGAELHTAPFNNPSRYQQIYAASQFSALSGPEYITQIAFRPATGQSAFLSLLPAVQFDLSTTATTPQALSATFADNVGPNDTVVFSGPLTVTSAAAPGPGNSTDFDILVPLTTPFLYDPSQGSLLLDIRDTAAVTMPFFVDAAGDNSAAPAFALVFADNTTSAATGTVQAGGGVTKFTFLPAPEPSAFAGLALGAFGLAGLGWKAKKRV